MLKARELRCFDEASTVVASPSHATQGIARSWGSHVILRPQTLDLTWTLTHVVIWERCYYLKL